MEDISKKLFTILQKACNSCQGEVISFSGGLDSTILTFFLKGRKIQPITIIAKNFQGNDLMYCQLVGKEFDLPLQIIQVENSEILEAIKETITILKNFNDIEIRNNVVIYLATKWAKDHGFTKIITGDGADELFAGYNFLVKKSEKELEKEIQRIYSVMHYPSQKIGNALKVEVESPFLNDEVVDIAKNIPSSLKVKYEGDKKYGKWILRKTFENKIPKQITWREKSPMQDGAGTNHLTEFFETLISDDLFVEKKKKIEHDHGITIRSKESLYYFEIFKKIYDLPKNTQGAETSCPYCKCSTDNSKFCRMCGAYPI